jgi:hypothetical protein
MLPHLPAAEAPLPRADEASKEKADTARPLRVQCMPSEPMARDMVMCLLPRKKWRRRCLEGPSARANRVLLCVSVTPCHRSKPNNQPGNSAFPSRLESLRSLLDAPRPTIMHEIPNAVSEQASWGRGLYKRAPGESGNFDRTYFFSCSSTSELTAIQPLPGLVLTIVFGGQSHKHFPLRAIGYLRDRP